MEDDFDVKFAEELQMLEGQPTLSVIACVCVCLSVCRFAPEIYFLI